MNTLYDKALVFATTAHEGQTRKVSGEPYIVHPIEVAKLVAERTDDEEIIVAALLHDTIEDCDVTFDEIQYNFGRRVAILVKEVTNVYTTENFPNYNRALRKQLEAQRLSFVSDDAKLIKACDVASNTKDVDNFDDAKYREIYVDEKIAVLHAIGYGEDVMMWAI